MQLDYLQFSLPEFAERYHYDGDDLGAVYEKTKTTFRVWAPTASKVCVLTYEAGEGGEPTVYPMEPDVKGTWVATIAGDLHGVYYTYEVHVHGMVNEAVDPYARAVGVNGKRGMVVNLAKTNPRGWHLFKKPPFDKHTDAIIYEAHIRDLTTHPESGIKNKGKFLGVVEPRTKGPKGVKTGLAHLQELGITHLHLLPCFDFLSIDESQLDSNLFQWGYDPLNYNVPEGSYSTDPYDGVVRIKEFKEMVKGLNRHGIRVVMDVVYNHTGLIFDSNLNKIVPGYYYRQDAEGNLSNGSGCGNELASERSMVRKLILDSILYWIKEYKIDGFRFDLMGLHDIDTMNAIREAVDEIDPAIILYGEGWTGGASPLPDEIKALKGNIPKMPGIGAFNDDTRDGIKGHVFFGDQAGFVSGAPGMEESVKFGVVAATEHDHIHYGLVMYSHEPWAIQPNQCINYAESHDNLTLWDKLEVSAAWATEQERIKMQKLATSIILTSQGIPFIAGGMEFLRSKDGDHNSYSSPDHINQLNWSRKAEYLDIFQYHVGLIELRKKHPAFRMPKTEQIQEHLRFIYTPKDRMVAFQLSDHANSDSWENIVVIYNANAEAVEMELPDKDWIVVVDGEKAGVEALKSVSGNKVTVPGRSAYVLVDQQSFSQTGAN